MDMLLTHAYFLEADPIERQVMRPYPPLGILYISAWLKKQGYAVEVADNTFSTPERFLERLRRERPPVLGIYINMMTKRNALAIMREAKELGCAVVVGGPDPPYYADAYLQHGADVVVIGEGEATLTGLLPELAKGNRRKLGEIQGIVFRDDSGEIVRTEPRANLADLNALPVPDREAIDLQAYVDAWRTAHGYGPVSLITARGCPYHCTWCSHSVYGHSFRKRSPENVLAEVEYLIERYRPDRLWFADDVFNIQKKWLLEYAALLKKRSIRIPFECICRADRLDEELVACLSEMGCFRMWLGSESGSQRLLDAMRRGVKAEKVQQMTRLARSYGIETGMFLMWGFEDENRSDVRATIEHVKRALPDQVLTTVSYPIKGTPYFQKMQEQGKLVADRPWEDSTDRDYQIRDRHSKRYYDFVNRWLYSEIDLQRGRENGGALLDRARARLNSAVGRFGSALTASQRDI